MDNQLICEISEKTGNAMNSLKALGKKHYIGHIGDLTIAHKFDKCWKIYAFHIRELFVFMIERFEDLFYSHNLKLFKNIHSFSTDCLEHYFVIPDFIRSEKITQTYMQVCLEKTNKYLELYKSSKRTEMIIEIYKAFGLPHHIPFDIKMNIVQFLYY